MTFSKVVSFGVGYVPECSITKWISKRTGLQLIHIDHKSSSLIQGFFVLATECPNDSGAPHTLEHLIFMGSEKYPYKGFLDTAGNLCMSSTNAWTATDHTAYTLTTAGWKGFSKLLPVYLDHVLNPTLTDAARTTEVYHIDPDDLTDKGVVYSEMDAIESQSWFVTNLAMQRLLYPQGSGYRSETGGLTKQLRNLTNKQIRQFHRDLYSSDNLCLIIIGNLPQNELLNIVTEWDTTLPERSQKDRIRPFIDNKYSQIPESNSHAKEVKIEFPELDETQGEILMTWIGESHLNVTNDLAITILMEYFTETELAPFIKEIVEVDDPLATSIDFWTDDYIRTMVNLSIHGVPTERLEETRDKILSILSSHTIDIDRMKQVIDNSKWDYIIRNEKTPENTLVTTCITDFLYGDDTGKSLTASLANLNDFTKLNQWTQEKWQSLLTHVFVNNKPGIVLGIPSAKLYEKINNDNEMLVTTRKNEFSQEMKAKLLEILTSAKKQNSQPIPKELLETFEMSNPAETVSFTKTHSITPIENFELNKDNTDGLTRELTSLKPNDFPFFIHLEHFPAQFIEFHCLLNSTVIKDTVLLPYYHVFDRLFSMPMKLENGTVIPYETVVSKLKDETIDSQISLGIKGVFPDLIDIRIRCKADHYVKAVNWVKYVLYDMVFDETRVSILLENYLNSIVELKREGDVMLASLTNRSLYEERSLKKSVDPLYVEDIIVNILEDIKNGKFDSVVSPKLEIMRNELRQHFDRFHLLILGDMEKIKSDLYTAWMPLVNSNKDFKTHNCSSVPLVPKPLSVVSDLCKNLKGKAYIITTPASESSYMNTFTNVKFDMNYNHPDYAAVSLASEYLQCVEGPFWSGIRGAGLAYGANMIKQVEINVWGFNIYRGSDIVKCYQVAKDIVENYANGTEPIDSQMIKASISSIINSVASLKNGYFATGVSNFTDKFILQRGTDFTQDYLKRLEQVTIEDLQKAIKKYLVNLFDSDRSVVFISCHPSKLDVIQEFFESQGFDIEVEELEDDEESEEEEEEQDEETKF